jgi:hypothetical protein
MSITTHWRPDGTLEVTCGDETILVPPRQSGASSGGGHDEPYGRGALSFGLVIGQPAGRGSPGSLPRGPSASSIAIGSASDMVKHIRKGKVDFTWESTKPLHVHDVMKRLGSGFAGSVAVNIRPGKKVL